MKKTLMIVGAFLLALVIAAGSFWGGMAYQTNRAEQARANFFNARGSGDGRQLPDGGQIPDGQMPGGGQFPNAGPGTFMGRGTTGQVKTIEGNVMTISTAEDVTTVNLSDSTEIQKIDTGSIADLQPGMRVTVSGETGENGDITARQITILNILPPNTNDAPAEGTAP